MIRKLPVIADVEEDLDAPPIPLFAVIGAELDAPRPRHPHRTDLVDGEVRVVLGAILRALRGEGSPVVSVPTPHAATLLDEVLGEGDAHVEVLGRSTYRAQESTMPGVWRVRTYDEGGGLVGDCVEVADVPRVVRAAAAGATSTDFSIPEERTDLMNARPLLAELRHRSVTHPAEGSNHVISLSLLPLSAGDVEALRSALGAGPVRGVSRGYGTCHVALTERARVWNVQYLNAMGAVVLDTLEVGDVPVALRAMPEDLQDSAARLETLLAGNLQ